MQRFSPLFTDLYELTMAHGYWMSRRTNVRAVFELFFRRCPFGGEYAVVSGHDRVKTVLENFSFSREDIEYLRSLPVFRESAPDFFKALEALDLSGIEVYGMDEGELVFPKMPLLQVRGPIVTAQLLESALLNGVNFATLVATYARRIQVAAEGRRLIEFGMRRAQGPDGAMTAARASFVGGFDGTSNVLAGRTFDIPVAGTMAHSFIQSYWEVRPVDLEWEGGSVASLLEHVRAEDGLQTNEGELGAFLAYARAFPSTAVLLVDTYDTLNSGVPNAIRIFRLLKARGYEPGGIRIDSGDLAYLSREARAMLDQAGFAGAKIFVSSELDEDVISSLQEQGARADAYGVGTHLVTASSDPALGGVYKLVEADHRPRLKLSQQIDKRVLPAAKQVYRLYRRDGQMLLDLIALADEPAPEPDKEILVLHPTDPLKKARVSPARVKPLLVPLFRDGKWVADTNLREIRRRSLEQMKWLRPDIVRRINPTPYKVSVTPRLKALADRLYEEEAPPPKLQ